MARKEDLQPHIYLPLPNPRDLPQSPSKDERLKNIISNLDRQHAMVRNNIIASAKEKHASQTATTSPNSPTPTPMDLSTPTEPTSDGLKDVAIAKLLSNLTAEAPTSETFDTEIPPAPEYLTQSPPPPEIAAAKEALDLVELYDGQAKVAREYYAGALERRKGSGSFSAAGGGMTERPEPAPTGRRQVSFAGGGMSDVDASKDPRMRGR